MISSRRLAVLTGFIVLLVVMILGRTVELQIAPPGQSGEFMQEALGKQDVTLLQAAPRGTIFDSDGNVMAVSVRSYSISIDPQVISATHTSADVALILAPVVSRTVKEVQAQVNSVIRDSQLMTRTIPNELYQDVSPQAIEQLTTTISKYSKLYNKKIDGIRYDRSWKRDYPMGPIAGPVVGYTGVQQRGFSGLEAYYDIQLSPQIGVRRERYPTVLKSITPTLPGADLETTLVGPLQIYVEERLATAIKDTGSVAGSIIVIDTHTAAVLAMASYPSYDPNNAQTMLDHNQAKALRNPAVSDLYEPGSVMKLITVMSAYDTGTMTPYNTWNDTGRFTTDGMTIRNADLRAHGVVTTLGMLEWSLNVVASQVSKAMGPVAFYKHMSTFGIGSPSGIDLADEYSAPLRDPSSADWRPLDMAEQSFGQSVQLSPLQLINAVNVMPNDGVLMRPYIVKRIQMADGQVVEHKPQVVRRVVSVDIARTLRAIAAQSTRTATPKALPAGYTVAGKTGTAQWFKNGEMQKTTLVSYVGWVPSTEPRVTILIKLDQPKKESLSAPNTIPVFHDVAERACQILGVPPDIIKESK